MSQAKADTSLGALIGLDRGGASCFLGVPFAEPPTRMRRFRHPLPRRPWSGELDATAAGPAPIQPAVLGLGMRGATRTSEDCLTLNIFTPSCDERARPVIVWIFGGAYVNGDGADPLFDGTRLAAARDVVVVTFNYRLGALGFAAIHQPNCGLADQVAVLEFVRDHIAQFGGDPACVTIVGESAGAMSVCNLLAAPSARGLFHRAIAQSGAARNVASPAQAQQAAIMLRGALDDAFESADTAEILNAQSAVSQALATEHRALPFRPCTDEALLPHHPIDVASISTVPLIMGMNAHENRLYTRASLRLSDEALLHRIAERVGERAPSVLDHYRLHHPKSAINENAAIASDIATELAFRQPMLDYVGRRTAPTWIYQFDWPSPALRGWLGACHAIEIPFVFGNFDLPSTTKFAGRGPDALALSDEVMTLWSEFARSGRPPARWPQFTQATRQQMHLHREPYIASLNDDPTRRFWEQL